MKRSNKTLVLVSLLVLHLATFAAQVQAQPEGKVTFLNLNVTPQDIFDKLNRNPNWKAVTGFREYFPENPPPAEASEHFQLLQESGLRRLMIGSFAQGRNVMEVRVYEMADPSAAFAVYTLTEALEGRPLNLGERANISQNKVQFWQSQFFVELIDTKKSNQVGYTLERMGRAASDIIQKRSGLPTLVKHLPEQGLQLRTIRYAFGPQGFAFMGLPQLKTENLGFDVGAEACVGDYTHQEEKFKLLLLSYPTPQLAKKFAVKLQDPASLFATVTAETKFYLRRIGPLIGVVLDTKSDAVAGAALSGLSYSSEVTWDEKFPSEELSYTQWLKTTFSLTGLVLLITAGAGLFFGIIRLASKKWQENSIFDRRSRLELIQLHLANHLKGVSRVEEKH